MRNISSKVRLPSGAKKKLAAYAALGAVGVVAQQDAQGAVVLNSGSIVPGAGPNAGESQWSIDLDGDTVVDVKLLLDPDGGYVYALETGPYPILRATGGSVAAVQQSITGYGVYVYAQKFGSSVSFGTSLGGAASSLWQTGIPPQGARMRDRAGFANSRWKGPANHGALGVRFTIGGNTHYGFVSVGIDDTNPPGANTPVFGTYGYESVPNSNIQPIPEPSSLGLLALGAAGLSMMRRRKKTPSCAEGI